MKRDRCKYQSNRQLEKVLEKDVYYHFPSAYIISELSECKVRCECIPEYVMDMSS